MAGWDVDVSRRGSRWQQDLSDEGRMAGEARRLWSAGSVHHGPSGRDGARQRSQWAPGRPPRRRSRGRRER